MAQTDSETAAALARSIHDPWFRCQALAGVAWVTPDKSAFLKLIHEAEQSALEGKDAYKCAAVLAWPVGALALRKYSKQAWAMLEKAVGICATMDNPVTKADALMLLWQAYYPLVLRKTSELLGQLTGACQIDHGWKGQRYLHDIALMVASENLELARRTIAVMRDGPKKRQAERRLAER